MKNTLNDPFGNGRRRRRSLCAAARSAWTEPLESRRLFDGLTGQYFNSLDQTELVTTRLDPQVNFSWTGSPATGVTADKFSVRWTGEVQANTSEVYTFYTAADDGVRLWVDGRLLVDNWVNQGVTSRSGTVAFEAGKRYDIRIDYYEYDQSAAVNLSWSTPTIAKQTIPAANLFAGQNGLTATYYNGTDFTGPAITRRDATVNAFWPTGTPDPTMPADGFSVRWSGYIVPQFSQTYTFKTLLQGTAITNRLRIDGQTVIDDASLQDSGRITLEAGKRYAITLEFATTDTVGTGIGLRWQSPSVPQQAIPTDRLIAGGVNSVPSRRVTYTNPVINADRPDPGILRADGAYWMVHTTGGPSSGWPLYKSLDGVNWTYQKDLLTTANKQSWMNGSYWAPEIHKVGNNFILTGTSVDSRTGQLVIAMASATTIDGAYTIRSEPLVSDTVADLDSTIFIDDDGTPYLIWKRDSDAHTGQHGSIRIRKLDATGLNFAAGSTTSVILDNETGGWENFLAEAPFMVRRGDYYYLFYSGAFIDTTYKLGVARSSSLTTMFTRNPANPIIGNNSVWGGPGHGGFEIDNDGNLWHLYHARLIANPDAGRKQVLDPVVWTASGWPSFASNSVSTTPQLGPKVDALQGAGVYTVSGDQIVAGQADAFRLVRSGATSAALDLYLNGVLVRSMTYAEVQSLALSGLSGNDTLTLDYTHGDVVPGSGLTFTGGAGTDNVIVMGLPGDLNIVRAISPTQLALGSGLFSDNGIEKLTLNGGAFVVNADLNALPLEILGGSVTFNANQRLGGLTIASGASALLAGDDRTLVTTTLRVDAGGKLDVNAGTVVVDYAVAGLSPIADIAAALNAGRAGGTWAGTSGIVTSMASAANPRGGGVLGYGEASALFPAFPAALGSATNIDDTAVVIRYTIDGDANLSQTVDFADLLTLARNYNATGKTFADGNFDYSADGSVGFDNLLILAKHYGASLPAAALSVTANTATTRAAKRATGATDVLA